MTPETALLLAQAIKTRDHAERGLALFVPAETPLPESLNEALVGHAEIWVHEQRIINRILSEATDA